MSIFNNRNNSDEQYTAGTGLNSALLATMLAAPVMAISAQPVAKPARADCWVLLSISGTVRRIDIDLNRGGSYVPKSALAKRLFEIRRRIKSSGRLVPAADIIENIYQQRLGA